MPPEHSRPSPSSLHQSKRQRHTYGAGAARSLTHHEQQILQQAASILGTTPSSLPHHLPYALSSISAYEDIISTAEPAPMPLPSLHQYSGAFTDIPPAETWDFTERSVGLSDSSPPQGALADAQFVPTPHMGLAVSSNCFRLYDFMQLEPASSLSVADLFSEDSSQVQQRYTFHMNMLQSSPGMDSDEFLDLRGAGEGLSIPPTQEIRSDVPEAGSNSNTETEVDRSSSGTLRSSPDAPPHLEAAAASTSNLDIAEIATPCLENAACPVLKTPRKRGPFKSEEEKRLTSFTRKLGACLRCRLQKIRCDPDLSNPKGSCNSCKGVEETALTRPFCTRARITDAKLYEKDSHPQFRWSRRWKEMDIRQEIKSWKSADIKTIQVTQDVGDLSYTLRVREFIPVAGDSLCRQWKTNGVQQSYPCAAYAIESMAAAGRQLVEFVANNIEASIDYYIDKSDWLMHQTYMEALKTSKTWKVGQTLPSRALLQLLQLRFMSTQ